MNNPYKIDGPACISFSGGRTSAYMLWHILDAHDGALPDDVVVCFANTGKERPETLDFVEECSERWDVEVVWLEWVRRDGPRHGRYRVVDYASADREGKVFEACAVARSLLPNPVMRFCTQEMKISTINNYLLQFGWGEYDMIVGIRADEPRRVAKQRLANAGSKDAWFNLMPLADAGVSEADVLAWWSAQPFNLRLQTWESNCDLCFLKGRNRIMRVMRDHPWTAEWWAGMERRLGATFRADRPSYQAMYDMVHRQPMLPMAGLGDPLGDASVCSSDIDDLGDCFCGD